MKCSSGDFMRNPTRLMILVLVVVNIFVSTGCQRDSSPQATLSTETKMIDLSVSSNPKITGAANRQTSFRNDDKFILAIGLTGTKPVDLSATLFYMNSGRKIDEQKRHVTKIAKGPEIFTFETPAEWEVGRYLLEVKLDGNVVAHQEIEVK